MLGQETIIEQFLEVYQRPTFREIAKLTGIQTTRVFRIFNGATMKVYEYDIFNKLIVAKTGKNKSVEALALECSQKLSPQGIVDLEKFLERKLALWEITQRRPYKNGSELELA